ncbi:CHAT domain-containing protein [Actinoplanes aureus]|uniref:CHAT domain-containing protein n=1 Tax=Actinoplanes aureus TaxID=2792083 RepID=A0A931CGZ1_9ACTN|nr:CHAT domain-containing protein [Actinoplanes aureus]MBG0567021.1 CHAT domain-containing protein [Actinoplanes aureus]
MRYRDPFGLMRFRIPFGYLPIDAASFIGHAELESWTCPGRRAVLALQPRQAPDTASAREWLSAVAENLPPPWRDSVGNFTLRRDDKSAWTTSWTAIDDVEQLAVVRGGDLDMVVTLSGGTQSLRASAADLREILSTVQVPYPAAPDGWVHGALHATPAQAARHRFQEVYCSGHVQGYELLRLILACEAEATGPTELRLARDAAERGLDPRSSITLTPSEATFIGRIRDRVDAALTEALRPYRLPADGLDAHTQGLLQLAATLLAGLADAFEKSPAEGLDNGESAVQLVLMAATGLPGLVADLAVRYRDVYAVRPEPTVSADARRGSLLLDMLARLSHSLARYEGAAGRDDRRRQTSRLNLASLDLLDQVANAEIVIADMPLPHLRAAEYLLAASDALPSLHSASALFDKGARLYSALGSDERVEELMVQVKELLTVVRDVTSGPVRRVVLPAAGLRRHPAQPGELPDRLARLGRAELVEIEAEEVQRSGGATEALELLGRHASDAAACGVIHPMVMRFLHLAAGAAVAATRQERLNAAVAEQIADGAIRVADALRLRNRVGEDRLQHADSLLIEEVYLRGAGFALDHDDVPGAISLADRAKGRGTLEQLALDDSSADFGIDLVDDQDWPDPPLERLRYLTTRVGAAIAVDSMLHPATEPIDGDGVRAMTMTTFDNVLVVQPIGGRVALMVLTNGFDSSVVESPVRAAELSRLCYAAQRQMHIHGTLRGAAGARPEPTDDLDGALRELRRALITPVEHLLQPGFQLTVVPYRELTLIPWGLLPDADGRPLSDDFAIALAPSVSILAALRERSHLFSGGTLRAYVAADPDLKPRDRARGLVALPQARLEANTVSRWVKQVTGMVDVITRVGGDATDRSFRTETAGASLLHLATHAVLREPAVDSVLYFTPAAGSAGTVTPADIEQLRLDDTIVFLAACDTGQGRVTSDGILGLGDAFLRAGAQAVVLSLTKVSDAATGLLADAFYRALTTREASVAQALQAASAATRDQVLGPGLIEDGVRLPPDPALWGSFFVLGDGHCKLPNHPMPLTWSRIGQARRPRDRSSDDH